MQIAPRPSRRAVARRGVLALVVVVLSSGCTWFSARPDLLAPAAKLYDDGERELLAGRYENARDFFSKLAERHPESDLVPLARFLVGESYYRARDYEHASAEFDGFVTMYPGHAIADLGQYRLARSYFDVMPTLERDQGLTVKALAEFQKLIRLYPESRYAPDAIVRIDACRLRLAQKEIWVAEFYIRQGNLTGALARYDAVLRDYARTGAAPQALYQKADVLVRLGRPDEAALAIRRLVDEFPASEWSRRARQERQTRLTSP